MNDLLGSKCPIEHVRFINQSNRWTLNNGASDILLFYSDGLHLIEKGNLKLGKSILKAIDSTVTSTSCIWLGKPSNDSNVRPSELVSASFFVQVNPFVIVIFTGVSLLVLVTFVQVSPSVKVMLVQVNLLVLVLFVWVNQFRSNIHPIKSVCASNICASKLICISNVCLRKSVSVSDIHPSKPIGGSNGKSSNTVCTSNTHPSNTVSASNAFPDNPVYSNIIRPS